MSLNIKKFCSSLNFKYLDNLNLMERLDVKDLLLRIDRNKYLNLLPKKREVFELFKIYFIKEKDIRSDDWVIKSLIGKPGKEGSAYIVYKKENPGREYVMKEFREKKSFEKVRNETKFQAIASIYGISPKIYEYGRGPKPYIIMDKMNEGTIIDVIKRQNGVLKEEQQKQLINIYKVLDSIGIHHNDMNLRNLMFNDGKLYIIDYGFSKFLEKDKSNFQALNLMMITMSGFQNYLRKAPKLLLPYLEKDIHRKYWIEKYK
jgi:predicted Ser/Thr protein kinase